MCWLCSIHPCWTLTHSPHGPPTHSHTPPASLSVCRWPFPLILGNNKMQNNNQLMHLNTLVINVDDKTWLFSWKNRNSVINMYSPSDSSVQHCCHIVFKWHLMWFIITFYKMSLHLAVFAIKTLSIEGLVHCIVGYCISSFPAVCSGCVVYILLNLVGVSIQCAIHIPYFVKMV